MERIDTTELHKRMKAQGVSSRDHIAFKCPICSTVQSMASLRKAGAPADKVENYVGFSCEGRFTNAGPFVKGSGKRGCDWTLGGLFSLHELEVTLPDGRTQPSFVVATPDEARALEMGAAATRA